MVYDWPIIEIETICNHQCLVLTVDLKSIRKELRNAIKCMCNIFLISIGVFSFPFAVGRSQQKLVSSPDPPPTLQGGSGNETIQKPS